MQMFTGKVKTYDPQTGKGSIAPQGWGEEVHVDLRSVGESLLSEGRKVSFRMIHRPDGVYACDIKLI